jgi:hypothetical protein
MSSSQPEPTSHAPPGPDEMEDPSLMSFNLNVWYVNPSDFRGEIPRVLRMCARDFGRKSYGKDMTSNPRAVRRLLTQLYNAEACLHRQPTIRIELDAMHEGIDYQCNFARAARVHGCDEWGHVPSPRPGIFGDPDIAAFRSWAEAGRRADINTAPIMMNLINANCDLRWQACPRWGPSALLHR